MKPFSIDIYRKKRFCEIDSQQGLIRWSVIIDDGPRCRSLTRSSCDYFRSLLGFFIVPGNVLLKGLDSFPNVSAGLPCWLRIFYDNIKLIPQVIRIMIDLSLDALKQSSELAYDVLPHGIDGQGHPCLAVLQHPRNISSNTATSI
jgi:hypothetical protein